jgi:CubicO group peptidase (beta-lactamase class C family)
MSLKSLALIENWPVPTAAAGVVRADGTVLGSHGPVGQRFPLASVTKPLAAYAALVAYEEGAIELDEPAGPAGSTVRHLLAHTSGLAFDEHRARRPHREGDGHPLRRVRAAGGAGAAGHDGHHPGRFPR